MPKKPWYAHHPILQLHEHKTHELKVKHFFNALSIPIFAGICMGSIAGSYWFFSQYQKSVKNATQAVNMPAPTNTPIPTASPFPTPWPTTPPPATVYSLSVRPKGSTMPLKMVFLEEFESMWKQHMHTIPAPQLLYDANTESPHSNEGLDAFNSDYFFILSSGSLKTPINFESESITASINIAPEQLKPYLYSNRFCQSSADCMVRESNCITGAYNLYETYQPSLVCVHKKMTAENNELNSYNSKTGCAERVSYASVTCQANRCQALHPTISCE